MVLGFPEPSAWMIYGVWSGGALFTLFYVVGFRKFFFTHEEERDFEHFVRKLKREREQL